MTNRRALGILAALVLLLATPRAFAQGRTLSFSLDGKKEADLAVRVQQQRVWVRTSWLKDRLGLDVKRHGAGGPVVVCRNDICALAAKDALTDDGAEADLDAALEAAGFHVALKVILPEEQVRYEVRRRALSPTTPVRAKVEEGQPFPDVALERIGGGRVRVSDFRGRKLLVVNWASW